MSARSTTELAPIGQADVRCVAEFLHEHLNRRVSADAWAAAIVPPWRSPAPNHGFLLRDGGRVVGVYLAFYSTRVLDGRERQVCNLGAWCVLDSHRSQGLRLLRALLAQRELDFTDLSPSGNVVPLNERLGFTRLDTSTALVPNLAWPSWSRRVRVVSDHDEIERVLDPGERQLFRDHRHAAAAHHLVLVAGDEHCYVVARRDRRKNLPLFASLLHVGNPALLARHPMPVRRYLLLRLRAIGTLSELRIVGMRPRLSVMLPAPRAKMFRSRDLGPDSIDYLYSELACVAW
jgi:hypothetical protein